MGEGGVDDLPNLEYFLSLSKKESVAVNAITPIHALTKHG